LGVSGDGVGGGSDTAVGLTGSALQYVLAPQAAEAFGALARSASYEFVYKTTDKTDAMSLSSEENSGSSMAVTMVINQNEPQSPAIEPNNVRFFVRTLTSGNSVTIAISNSAVCDGNYHDIVFTYNGTNTGNSTLTSGSTRWTNNLTSAIYFDGVLQTNGFQIAYGGAQPPSNFGAFGVPIVIGTETAHAANTLADYFTGTIDEAVYYTNALSPAQVLANYNALIGNVTNDLWTGAVNNNWDAGTANWTNSPNTNVFANGDLTVFDDTASNFTVNVAANVTPLTMTFSNSLNNYTIGSAGGFSIGGVAALTTRGTGTVTLLTTNTFTGPIVISAGQLIIGGGGQLGSGAYAGKITDNGIFTDGSTSAQILGGVISGTGTVNVNASGAALTLNNINSYTGPTIVGAGTLFLSGAGSIGTSSSISISNGAVFDVTGTTGGGVTLGANQNLLGGGTVNGSLTTSGGSKIFPGTDGTVGTLTFNNNLTLASGATVNFDVSTSHSGANDQIVVNGALTLNGNTFHIKAPPASSLDSAGDYVLITATGGITGSFVVQPTFDVAPANAGNYSIVTDTTDAPNVVKLHYTATSGPTAVGTATPSTGVLRNGTVNVSVTVTHGTSPTINSVTLDLSSLGGSSTSPLFLSATPNVWTNTIIIPPGTTPGIENLTATATDANSLQGLASISFTVVASTETWTGLGANQNWDTNPNWLSGFAPGYAGDSLVFAGTTGTNTVLDQDYNVSAITFSSNAGAFTITNVTGDYLTLAANSVVTNNSAQVEILNVPIQLAGGTTLASVGNLVLAQPIGELVARSGTLTSAGGTNILAGVNTYSGSTVISGGALTIAPGGVLGNGTYAGNVINSGTFNYNSGVPETFQGTIAGAGAINISGGGSTSGPIVTLAALNTFIGNVTISNTYVSDAIANSVTQPQNSGVGNPQTLGQTITINNNAIMSFDANNPLGSGNAFPLLGWIINQGGVLQITTGNIPTIGNSIALNGGTLIPDATGSSTGMGLGNAMTVGGTSPSIITNTSGSTVALSMGIGQGNASLGQTTFTVAASPAALIVAVPLAGHGLVLTGGGTMTLTAANTYTGNTTVNSGTLILADPGRLGGGSYAGSITNNSAFISSTTAGQTLTGVISGTGLLEANGAGATLTLSGVNTFSGGTLITNGATLNVINTSGSATGTGSVIVSTNGTLTGTGRITGNVVWQPGALAAFTQGSPLTVGVVTLNSNTATVNVPGGTPLTAGTYALMNYTAAGSSGVFNPTPVITGAGAAAGLIPSITTSGGIVSLTLAVPVPVGDVWNAGNGNWSAGVNWSSNPTVPGNPNDNPGDAATLGVGVFSGLTTVALDADESLADLSLTNVNSFVIANSGNTLNFNNYGNGAYIAVTGGTSNLIQTAMALDDTVTVTVNNGDSLAISGLVSNNPEASVTPTLTLIGQGTLILGNNNNSYGTAAGSLGTILNSGTLQVGSDGALGAGDVSFAGNSKLQSGAAGLVLANNISVNSGTVATLDDNGNTFTLGGVIGGGGIYSKTGASTLILTNNNNFSGALNVNAGTVILSGDNSGASGAITNGATLQLANPSAVGGSSLLALDNNSTLQLRSDSSVSFSPASLALQNASDTLNFDVNSLTGATGNTLTLAGALAFANNSSQTITVTGNSTYTLSLGAVTLTSSTAHTPYLQFNVNTFPTGAGVVINSITTGNWGADMNMNDGGKVTVAGNLSNTSNGNVNLFVNNGTTVTLEGQSIQANAGDGYKYDVVNGTLVLDNSSALINNTTGSGLNQSVFILGAATNVISGATYTHSAGVLTATNNNLNAAVYLGDAINNSGGLTVGANITNYVSDGDVGFTNSGVFTIGGQNTSGANVYANPIILGWTPNRGKSVMLVAATGGEVDFANILANGTDQTAGVTVGDATHNGLVKFTGVNTYSGNTTVNGGTLEVANANFSSNSTVTITNGATLQLDFSGANIVNALVLNGVSKPAGTYNSGNTALITGSGSIQVVPLAGSLVAGFSGTPTSGIAPLIVTFTDASSGSITNWIWDFGDGNSVTNSSSVSVNHAYAAGTYNMSLTVNGSGGSSLATSNNYIVVTAAAPVAGFTAAPTNIFVTQTVTFSDASSGSITNWVWNFGDGSTSVTNTSNFSVNHAYVVTGTDTASLTVNGAGGSSSATQNIVVKPRPMLGRPVLSGSNLILSGVNGPAGQQYRILSTTNVALPLASWTPVYTNTFNADGSYGYTNTSLANKAAFLLLVSP
jgi:autotransporter-associated beta strand protein